MQRALLVTAGTLVGVAAAVSYVPSPAVPTAADSSLEGLGDFSPTRGASGTGSGSSAAAESGSTAADGVADPTTGADAGASPGGTAADTPVTDTPVAADTSTADPTGADGSAGDTSAAADASATQSSPSASRKPRKSSSAQRQSTPDSGRSPAQQSGTGSSVQKQRPAQVQKIRKPVRAPVRTPVRTPVRRPVQTPKPVAKPITPPASGGSSKKFTGSVAGTPFGPVQVSILVSNNRIVDATAVKFPTDAPLSVQLARSAIPKLRQETLASQSADVANVSGASYTSGGWKKSLQAAISAAGL